MPKSVDLFEVCPICDGKGSLPNKAPISAPHVCPACRNERYTPVGLNTGQFDLYKRRADAADGLLEACEAVLGYIASHQVYDKDARGMLERAIAKAKGEM